MSLGHWLPPGRSGFSRDQYYSVALYIILKEIFTTKTMYKIPLIPRENQVLPQWVKRKEWRWLGVLIFRLWPCQMISSNCLQSLIDRLSVIRDTNGMCITPWINPNYCNNNNRTVTDTVSSDSDYSQSRKDTIEICGSTHIHTHAWNGSQRSHEDMSVRLRGRRYFWNRLKKYTGCLAVIRRIL